MKKVKSRQAVLLCAHKMTKDVVDLLRELQNDCAGEYDVWLVYDNTREDFDASLINTSPNAFLFNLNSISQRYYMTSCDDRGRIYDGNTTFPILEFYRSHSEYDYYWRIEYDVRFGGNWRNLFDYFADNDSDLLTTTLYRHDYRPDWMWWRTLKTPWHIRNVNKIRGFLPVARKSAAACKLLSEKYRKAWKGHDEVVVPTLLHHYGLKIEDIGGDGDFTEPQNINRFYTNTPNQGGLAPGTMVCPPQKPEILMVDGKLYHPVK